MKINKIALFLFAFILYGCASPNIPTATPTELPPTPTFTLTPTNTPISTETLVPTYTPSPVPTETELPTFTPGPSPTPIKVTSQKAVLIPNIGSPAQSMAWSRDGKYLYIGTLDKGLAIYDVVNKKLFPLVGNNANISSLALSLDGKILAAGIANDGSIRLWGVENIFPESEVTIFPAHGDKSLGYDVPGLAFSPNGKLVASCGFDGKIIVWDVKTGKMIKKFDVQDSVFELVFSPDGKTLIAGLSVREEFDVWSTDTWDIQNTFKGDQANDLAISPDGSKMVSAGGGIHEANLWDIKTGKLLFNFEKSTEGMAWAVSYDPSGKLVALGGGGDTVFLWDVFTGSLVWELNTTLDATTVIAFSPDGSQLATGGTRVRIWNMEKP